MVNCIPAEGIRERIYTKKRENRVWQKEDM